MFTISPTVILCMNNDDIEVMMQVYTESTIKLQSILDISYHCMGRSKNSGIPQITLWNPYKGTIQIL